MNLTIKYTPVLVSEPKIVRDFLMKTLGFTYSKNTSFYGDKEGIIVGQSEEESSFLLLLRKNISPSHKSTNCIVVNTRDCLRDYHHLVQLGVEVITEPQYTGLGLVAEIADTNSIHYILLEERNYLDQ